MDDFYKKLDHAPEYAQTCIKEINRALKLKNVEILINRSESGRPMEKLTNRTTSFIDDERGAYFQISSPSVGVIATFTLCQLRGCCGVCMTTGEYVSHDFRRKGVATILGKFRKAIAKDRGFTILFCTDVVTNVPQKKVLGRHGWTDVFRFRNRRTRNLVDLSVVALDPQYEAHPLFVSGEDKSCPTIQSPSWKPANSSPRTSWFSWLFTPLF